MEINGRYFLDDAETGLYEVSKEEYERHNEWRRLFFEHYIKPNVNLRRKGTGKIIITSNRSENDNSAFEFYKLWADKK